MRQIYSSPPVIEALCEFRFKNLPTDPTVPGLFYTKIREQFPQKGQVESVELTFADGNKTPKVSKIQKSQFFSSDKTKLVQLGPDVLVINHLSPYPTWVEFKELIFNVLHSFKETVELAEVERIGLRYINRIILDDKQAMTNYFNYYPLIPQGMGEFPNSLVLRTETNFPNQGGRLLVTLALENEADASFILDLDFVSTRKISDVENAKTWIESAHEAVETAFEACISDLARKSFEEETK